ncbi:hypothetical protein [Roseivirga misakiensis]|uniref:Uncharacterized protein n=1 Tax=Roseivirga misakiensis TaxID=1563681 RepID=A0A1E5SL90_9BACT|nr:hypothetical protein [Roseivirga misakiensis]OEJ99890.1 hypothetical protein BFP71_10100 [Roseivirga misakiensis]
MKYSVPVLILFLFTLSCQKQDQSTVSTNAESDKTEVPLDTLLKNQLEYIRAEDQVLRMMLPDLNKRYSRGTEEQKVFRELIAKQDSLCEIKVRKILDDHGWVSSERIGYMANQTLWLVIQHAPLETQI